MTGGAIQPANLVGLQALALHHDAIKLRIVVAGQPSFFLQPFLLSFTDGRRG